ncbi:MAG: hypothetical protein V1766_00735 [Pseudomonadota bacterium]
MLTKMTFVWVNQQKGEAIYQKTVDSMRHSHNDRQRAPYFVVSISFTQNPSSHIPAVKKEILVKKSNRVYGVGSARLGHETMLRQKAVPKAHLGLRQCKADPINRLSGSNGRQR